VHPTVEDRSRRQARNGLRRLLLIAVLAALHGCALRGAPTYAVFGAYFPLWLVAGILGVFAALIANRFVVGKGLFTLVPHQLLVCASIGMLVAVLFWAIVAGEFG
jgi:hypothetical protein